MRRGIVHILAATALIAAAGGAKSYTSVLTQPHRRAGLWEQKTRGSPHVGALRICLDDAYESKILPFAQKALANCRVAQTVQRGTGAIATTSVCREPDSQETVIRSVVWGDFRNSYRVRLTTEPSSSGPHGPAPPPTIEVIARWIGPCPVGMAPGEVRTLDGAPLPTIPFARPDAPAP